MHEDERERERGAKKMVERFDLSFSFVFKLVRLGFKLFQLTDATSSIGLLLPSSTIFYSTNPTFHSILL